MPTAIDMAEQGWSTISVKVNETTRNAIGLICKHEGIRVNRFLADIIAREVEPILDPKALPENKGIPQVGENRLKYIPESDSFIWQVNLGVHGVALLSESVSRNYLENLKKAIEDGLSKRADFREKHKKGAVLPSKLLKYGVKKHAGTRA